MDEHRHNASLSDEQIDDAIGELLSVEPSADFVARVRTRLEDQPVRARWFGPWLFVAAGAVASVVVIGALWMAGTESVAPVQSQPAVAVAAPVEPTPPPVIAAVTREPDAPSRPAAEVPAVQVSAAEVEGLRYFVSALRDGRLDPAALPAESGELEDPMPIVIEPITVEPLLSAGDLETGELQ